MTYTCRSLNLTDYFQEVSYLLEERFNVIIDSSKLDSEHYSYDHYADGLAPSESAEIIASWRLREEAA